MRARATLATTISESLRRTAMWRIVDMLNVCVLANDLDAGLAEGWRGSAFISLAGDHL
jgi:hypothetical protein